MLAAISLIYTEGHTATTGESLDRPDLCTEAVRLARVLATGRVTPLTFLSA